MDNKFVTKSSGIYKNNRKPNIKNICKKPSGDVNEKTIKLIKELKSKCFTIATPSVTMSSNDLAYWTQQLIHSLNGTNIGVPPVTPTPSVPPPSNPAPLVPGTVTPSTARGYVVTNAGTSVPIISASSTGSNLKLKSPDSKSISEFSISELIDALRSHNLTLSGTNEGRQLLQAVKKIDESLTEFGSVLDGIDFSER